MQFDCMLPLPKLIQFFGHPHILQLPFISYITASKCRFLGGRGGNQPAQNSRL